MVRYPAAETAEKHKRILEQASRLFRERGIAAVSVPDLMQAADLTHGAFYNHFKSKQALVSDCVSYLIEPVMDRIAEFEPTAEGRRAFAREYASPAARDDPGTQCLMSSLGGDIARDPAVRPSMTRYVHAFIAKLALHFPWGRRTDARRDAIRMTASLVGALVLSRAVDDRELSDEILREVVGQFAGGASPAKANAGGSA